MKAGKRERRLRVYSVAFQSAYESNRRHRRKPSAFCYPAIRPLRTTRHLNEARHLFAPGALRRPGCSLQGCASDSPARRPQLGPSSELGYSSALMQKPLPAWADSRGLRVSATRTTTLTWSMKSEMNVPDSISRSIFTRCAEPSNMQSSARHSGLSLQQRCFQKECCSVFSRRKWMCVGLA